MLKKKLRPCILRQLSKKAISVVLSLSMLFAMACLPMTVSAVSPNWQDSGNVATGYAGGSGTASDPYQIATAGQLAYLAKTVNASAANTYDGVYFIQTGDIDLSGKEWTPIGMRVGDSQCYYLSKFDGYFNGDGYSITGLTINADLSDGYAYYGLFGIAQYGLLENIKLTNVDIGISGNNSSDSFYVGGLAGYLITGAANCHVSGTIDTSGSTNLSTGGLAGQTYYSASVINCSSSCTILGSQTVSSGGNVGGVLGENFGVIKNCFATGTITGDKSGSIGGIAGVNSQSSTIENCYTNCAVSTAVNVGGIAGCSGGAVTNCYAAGSESDSTSTWVGGIVGNSYGTVSNCYYNSDKVTEDRNYSEVGMTTADMQASPFVTMMNSHLGSGNYRWAADSGTSPANDGYPVLLTSDTDATLSGLSVGTGSLSPAFSSAVTTYTEDETTAVSSINVTPIVSDTGKATVTVNGAAATSGSAANVTVTPGIENDIKVVVTAENTSIMRIYLIKVKDGPDIDAALSGLSLSAGSLSPAFSASATNYNATIPSSTGSITVTPTVHDLGRATVTVNGTPVASGSASSAISLTPGTPVTITVNVTAEDGSTNKTYTIHATETLADATLSDLAVNEGTLSPYFDSSTTSYILTMPKSVTSVTVTPTATDSRAAIKVNGAAVGSGAASGAIALTPGTASDITVTVKGSDGVLSKNYVLHVQWALPNWQDSGNAASGFNGGSGSSGSPYQIATAGQLAYFAQQVNNGADYSGDYFVLNNDINLSAYQWTPIGNDSNVFNGIFDGAGHQITGLAIGTVGSSDPNYDAGLFGHTGTDSSIKNVSVEAAIYSTSGGYVGGLAGYSEGSVTGCSVSGTVKATGDWVYAGGLTGESDEPVTDCFATAAVTGDSGSSTGGLIGVSQNSVTGSYSTGNVVGGDDSCAGGLVGCNYQTSIVNSWASGNARAGDASLAGGLVGCAVNGTGITNCFATGNAQAGNVFDGFTAAGGLIGYVYDNLSLVNCYATGDTTVGASGSDTASEGGLIGRNNSNGSTISNCYWNTDATQTANGTAVSQASKLGIGLDTGSITGTVTGKSAAEMQTAAFAQLLTNNRTDTSVQKAWICISNLNKGYPLLNGVGFNLSSDSALSALSVSSGALSPSFSAAATSYSVSVTNSIASITVTPTAHDSSATVTVSGVATTSGRASQAISLTADQTESIPVVVTATDGSKTTYTINVTRAATDTSFSSGSGSSSSGSSSSSSGSGSSSSSSPASSSGSGVQITGTATGGDLSDYTASVSARQAANGSVTVTLGGIIVKDTGSVLSNLIASTPGFSLRLTETPTTYSAEIATLAGSNSIVSAFDIDLFSVSSSGSSTQLHQLGGNITVTIALTNAQKAQITDPSTAKLYYYDPDTKSLVDMHADFDMRAGTVTFTTNHLSTFVLEQGKAANPKTDGGNSTAIPLAILSACSASGFMIIKKRVKWKVKSHTANK